MMFLTTGMVTLKKGGWVNKTSKEMTVKQAVIHVTLACQKQSRPSFPTKVLTPTILNQKSCSSSETSSYNSECHDDEEIALAVQAAELASRNHARARFRSSSDMIHRLFVCISG
nr:hypothetical protein BaRGS_030882 [Batillaria attramentaria]